MAGPVWQRGEHGPYTCDECFREVDQAMLLGEVRHNRFVVRRTLCDTCYAANARLLAKAS